MIDPRPMRKLQAGLTLVEVMIAMVLSMLLLVGAVSIFVGSKETFNVQEDLSRVQENVRFGVGRLFNDISPTGYVGCSASLQGNLPNVTNALPTADINKISNTPSERIYDFANPVYGEEGGTDPDKLTLHFALPDTAMPILSSNLAGNTVTVPANHERLVALKAAFDNGATYVSLSDCNALAVYKVAGVTLGNGVIELETPDVAETYPFGTSPSTGIVQRIDAVLYETDLVTSTRGTVRNLYQTRIGDNRQLVLNGVEDFQVQYGIDTTFPQDGTVDQWLDWSGLATATQLQIAALRIDLRVNPGDPVASPSGADTEFAHDLTYTVRLRNKGLE